MVNFNKIFTIGLQNTPRAEIYRGSGVKLWAVVLLPLLYDPSGYLSVPPRPSEVPQSSSSNIPHAAILLYLLSFQQKCFYLHISPQTVFTIQHFHPMPSFPQQAQH